jgi:hypothetical protein
MDKNQELSTDGKALVPAGASPPVPATGTLAKQQLPFEEVVIELDHTGAWTLDGKVAMAFGPGAELIGNTVGVAITKPAKVTVNEEEKDNPHIIYDDIGQPSVLWFRKIGVFIGKDGMIRHADITDRIDIGSYIAERAIKAKKSKDTPDASAIFCTKTQAQAWNEKAKEPKDDIWWFVPTQGTEIGIAFNLATTSKGITKLQEDVIHMRKPIIRRFETATNRRVIATLVPEYTTTKDADFHTYQPYKDNPNYKVTKVIKAKFTVQKPAPASQFQGLEMGLYQQIARAIREDNKELRERALASFSAMYGVEQPEIIEVNPDTAPDPINITGDFEPADEDESKGDGEIAKETTTSESETAKTSGDGNLDPVPITGKMTEFRAYVKTQIPKMNEEQKAKLREIVGPDCALDGFKGSDIGKEVMKYFIGIAGKEQEAEKPSETGEVTTETMRKFLNEKLGEGDKKLSAIFYERYGEEWQFDQLSDVEIGEIYGEYTGA